MKFLIFSQHFPPETVATGRRAYNLAEALALRGHHVTVITGVPNHPSSLNLSFCKGAPLEEMAQAGYRILRVPVFRSEGTRTRNRILTYATFALASAWAGLGQKKPDAILAISPLPTGLAAMLVHCWHRAPLIFDLQDIWPDSALAVGVVQSGLVLRVLRWVEQFFYRRCALIVCITHGFRRYLLKLGVAADRLAVIHNGVEWKLFADAESDRDFRQPHHLNGKFVVGYVGNIGLAQGLDTLLDAAEELRSKPITFLAVGEGTDKDRLQTLARTRGITNVEFLEGVPRERVPALLAACDALLLMLRSDPLFEITVPSKLYEYMAAGRPVICSVGGEAAGLVEKFRCGISVPPSSGSALAAAIRKLCEDPALRREMGERGKYCAREIFPCDRLMSSYTELAEATARPGYEPAGRQKFPHLVTAFSGKGNMRLRAGDLKGRSANR